eukprot:12999701-Heterocapsa_arctica.AAC.1
MFTLLGGWQLRYYSLLPAKGPQKVSKDKAVLLAGFAFIKDNGPTTNSNNEMTEWSEIEIHDPDSVI